MERDKLHAEIRECYARMGTSLAEHWSLLGEWSAHSQYGYVLSWHATQTDAENAALAYYETRMHLIRQ